MSEKARQFGGGVATVARRIGPKRGALALGIVVAGIGAVLLIRYLRARDDEESEELAAGTNGVKKQRRSERRHAEHLQ